MRSNSYVTNRLATIESQLDRLERQWDTHDATGNYREQHNVEVDMRKLEAEKDELLTLQQTLSEETNDQSKLGQ